MRTGRWDRPAVPPTHRQMDIRYLRGRGERGYVKAFDFFIQDREERLFLFLVPLRYSFSDASYDQSPLLSWSKMWQDVIKNGRRYQACGVVTHFFG